MAAQAEAWNRHDATAWSKDFAPDADFVNIVGTVFQGREEIEKRHAGIFASVFKTSSTKVTVRRIVFLGPDVAIVDTDHEVTGHSGLPPGVQNTDESGTLQDADEVRDEEGEGRVADRRRAEHGREARAQGLGRSACSSGSLCSLGDEEVALASETVAARHALRRRATSSSDHPLGNQRTAS